MNADGLQHDPQSVAAMYLRELGDLGFELQVAMSAIASNTLPVFEESVWKQELLCGKLEALARLLDRQKTDPLIAQRIHLAAQAVHDLNHRYEILVHHSGRFTQLLSNLHNSYSGTVDPTLYAGNSTRQTLSCEV